VRRYLPDFAVLVIAAGCLLLGRLSCGRSLGLVFFGVIVPPLLTLPLAGRGAGRRLLVTTALCALLAGGVVAASIRPGLGVQTAALSAALALAMAGVVEILARSPRVADFARAMGGIALIAWLTWPVWMASLWADPAVARWLDPLVAIHPLLAINGAGLDLGPWSHAPIAYRYLLNLGQDVPYALPGSAWRAVATHAGAGAVLLGLARYDLRMSRAVSVLCVLLLMTGCQDGVSPRAAGPVAPAGPVSPPVLVHLPGVAGPMEIDRTLVGGLVEGGVAAAGEMFDWNEGRRGLPALNGYDENRRQAARLAKRLIELHAQDPRRRITVTAHSGGTAVAVWALEQLPAGVEIDRLVLLASALSPGYDLSPALSRVSGKAFSFHSSFDREVLGLGTRMFGTMDRQHTDAAGYVGFTPPPAADPRQYAKLEQIAYDADWQRYGHWGDHIGMMTSAFAASHIAPMITPAIP
jgi:hypothetical protein